jgi:hypothetical protein
MVKSRQSALPPPGLALRQPPEAEFGTMRLSNPPGVSP